MTVPVRPYRQPVSRFWWAQRRSYRWFMLREISCVAVAWSVGYLVLLVYAVGAGRRSYERFLDWSAHPCLLYTSPSPRDGLLSRMPSSA